MSEYLLVHLLRICSNVPKKKQHEHFVYNYKRCLIIENFLRVFCRSMMSHVHISVSYNTTIKNYRMVHQKKKKKEMN